MLATGYVASILIWPSYVAKFRFTLRTPAGLPGSGTGIVRR